MAESHQNICQTYLRIVHENKMKNKFNSSGRFQEPYVLLYAKNQRNGEPDDPVFRFPKTSFVEPKLEQYPFL